MQFLHMLLPFLLVAGTAWSEQISLQPPDSAVELRTYGFGVIPFDGNFTRFQGWMRYDPANTNTCQVMLEIEANSLAMANQAVRSQIMGFEMMDVARFPQLKFQGACQGASVVGNLTMHGETHRVILAYTRAKGIIIATGQLHRANWGISGNPLTGGSVIRIRVVLPDPSTPPHA